MPSTAGHYLIPLNQVAESDSSIKEAEPDSIIRDGEMAKRQTAAMFGQKQSGTDECKRQKAG